MRTHESGLTLAPNTVCTVQETTQTQDMMKEWNKCIRSYYPTPSLPCLNGHFHHLIFLLTQVRRLVSDLLTTDGKKILRWKCFLFFLNGFMFWAVCFSRTKHGSTWMDTLVIKTIEYGVLKTHMCCMKFLWIWQNLVFGVQILLKKLSDIFLLRDKYWGKSSKIFFQFNALVDEKQRGMLVTARNGYHPICEKNRFLAVHWAWT